MTELIVKSWIIKSRGVVEDITAKGPVHAKERDRVGEAIPVHEGKYRPVRLLSRERRNTMLGIWTHEERRKND
jgi:hypothetical protein